MDYSFIAAFTLRSRAAQQLQSHPDSFRVVKKCRGESPARLWPIDPSGETFTEDVHDEEDLRLSYKALSAIAAGGYVTSDEFLQINGLKLVDLQANLKSMLNAIHTYGMSNYTVGVNAASARPGNAL